MTTGGERDDVPPEPALEVVVRSPEIQDAEPIRSAPISGAATSSQGGIELLADDLVDPATVARHMEVVRQVKDRLGDQRGGSEWEPIKILLEGDRNSDKMNSLDRTPKITRSALLPSVCQNHVATGVLLVLGTNTTSNLNTHAPTTAETTRKPAVQRGRLDQV
jgi:hypothetical protein